MRADLVAVVFQALAEPPTGAAKPGAAPRP
jgi:hypothetical protein